MLSSERKSEREETKLICILGNNEPRLPDTYKLMYARVDVRVCSSNKNVRYERRLREDLSFVLLFSFYI